MAISIQSVARTLGHMSHWRLSNLALQKMSYIADMINIGRTGSPLVSEDFEAWDNGPVVPSLYHLAKSFGSGPVSDVFRDRIIERHEPEYRSIYDAYMYLYQMDPGQMVAQTHRRNGAWAARYRPNMRGVVIPKDLIRQEASQRPDIV